MNLNAESAESGWKGPPGIASSGITTLALAWSLFQLWYASPLPFAFNTFILNDTEARSIHLGFAVSLAFLVHRRTPQSGSAGVPIQDLVLAIFAAGSASYLFWFYRDLSTRPGLPTAFDLTVSILGLITLLEAGRRTMGVSLSAVALLFLVYNFAGPWLPGDLAHKGASIAKVVNHQWLSTGGVFGVALGASTTLVFMFMLFGALLKEAGAGSYFIRLAMCLVGHMTGGAAKAAVLASGLTGTISGSTLSNVVTTGTFTIPLMIRTGFSREKAGAIECAASLNGQLMPPVMGAAAFLMAEYVGVPYVEILKHALLPAVLTYVTLLYIVHLEAKKAGIRGLPRLGIQTQHRFLLVCLKGLGVVLCAVAGYFGMGWLIETTGSSASWYVSLLLVATHLGLVYVAAKSRDLPAETLSNPASLEVMTFTGTARSGLFFFLPIAVLLWCLMVERLSADLSAFWATCVLIVVVLTQHPLIALFRRSGHLKMAIGRGIHDLFKGLVAGATSMVVVALATAISGVIVGTVSQTGISQVLVELVEFLSGGSTLLMLVLAAVATVLVGMGMPSTASYIVVATLMAPVVTSLAAENGWFLPIIAVHMFVFYFGLMADATPPVALGAYAAAAIAQGDSMRTGMQAFLYESRTCILPFMFIVNHELLLIGVKSWAGLAITVSSAMLAMLLFAAALQGWFLTRSRLLESAFLLVAAFSLFRPDFWMDRIYAPFNDVAPTQLLHVVDSIAQGEHLFVKMEGETLEGDLTRRSVMLPLGPKKAPLERLMFSGVEVEATGDKVVVRRVRYGSAAEKKGIRGGWQIVSIVVPAERPAKEWGFAPALILIALVVALQRRRTRQLSLSGQHVVPS